MADKNAKWSFVCAGVQFIFHVHPHEHIAKRYWDAHKFVNIMCVYIATTEILKSHIKDTETAGVKILFEFFITNTCYFVVSSDIFILFGV